MPHKGQKCITIPKHVFEIAKKMAEKEGKSVAGFITELVLKKAKEAGLIEFSQKN